MKKTFHIEVPFMFCRLPVRIVLIGPAYAGTG